MSYNANQYLLGTAAIGNIDLDSDLEIIFGKHANNKKGDANPAPKDNSMVIVIKPVDTKAYPRAPAINGAVHGVATTTAKAPVKNEPE